MNNSHSDTPSSNEPNENELNAAPTSVHDFRKNGILRLDLASEKNEIDERVESSEPITTTVSTTVSQDLDPHGHNEGEASNHVSLFEPEEDQWEDGVSPPTEFSEQTSHPAPDEDNWEDVVSPQTGISDQTSKPAPGEKRFMRFTPAAVARSSVPPKTNELPEQAIESVPEKSTRLVEQIAPVPQKSTPYADDVDEFLKEAYRDADDVDKLLAEIDAAQATPRKHLTSRPNRRPSRLWTVGEIIPSSTTAISLEPPNPSPSRLWTEGEMISPSTTAIPLGPTEAKASQSEDSISQPQYVIGDDFIQNVTKDRNAGYVGRDPSLEMYLLWFLAVSILVIAIVLWKRKVLQYVFHVKLGKGFDDGVAHDYEKVLEDPCPDSPRKEVALVQSSFTPPPVTSAPRTRRNSGVQITREALSALTMGRRSLTCASLPVSVASTPISTRKSSRPKSSRRPTDLVTDGLNGGMIGLSPSLDDFGSVAFRENSEGSTTSSPFGISGRRHNHKSSNSFDPSLIGFVASLSGKGRESSPALMDNDFCSTSEARSRSRQATTDLILTDARGNNLHMGETRFPSPDAITDVLLPSATSITHHRRPLPFQLRAALGDLLPTVAASPLFPPGEGQYGGDSTGLFESQYDPDTTTALEKSHYEGYLTTQNDLGKQNNFGTKLRRTTSAHSHLSSLLTNVQNEGLLYTPSSTRSASSSATSSPRGTPVFQKRSQSYSKPPQATPSCPHLSNDEFGDGCARGRNRLRKDDQGGWQDDGWGEW